MLIAEISNNHFGNFALAKEMIRIAKESGADAVKGQAFVAEDFINGSMPSEFYETCAFTLDQYIDLIAFGADLKIPVFYSILSKEMIPLTDVQKYNKITAKQWETFTIPFEWSDEPGTFISMSSIDKVMTLDHAQIMYASPYMCEKVDFVSLFSLKSKYGRAIGLSDHSTTIRPVIEAIAVHNIRLIEKHFTLEKNHKWQDEVYRDSIHGALPKELEKIAKALGG